jgi:hypothetical protein
MANLHAEERSMRTTAALMIAILGVCFAPALAAQEAKLIGHWEGALVLAAAEQEIDVLMDFNRADGQAKGQLWFPLTADGAHEISGLAVQGSHVSFSVSDKDGVVSTFDGTLSPDGNGFQGTMKENGKPVPFMLHRAKTAEPLREIPTYKLAGDALQLKAAFNEDVGKARMLLLVNLGSFSSKLALRIVERYVMDQIGDPNLRVYVVWLVPNLPQAEKVLQREVGLAPDPRITHFWSTDASPVKLLEPVLAPYKPAANPCLLFAGYKTWTAGVPLPDRVRKSAATGAKNVAGRGEKLNGLELAADVRWLLGK